MGNEWRVKMNYIDLLSILGVGGAHPGGILLTKKIFENAQIPFDAKILDAGCGTGQTSSFLYQLGYDISGLDIDSKMLIHAKNRNKTNNSEIPYIHEDLSNTTFANDTFDLVLCESVLNFTSLDHTLAEISRILKPNGILIAIEMTKTTTLTETEEKEITTFYGCEHIFSTSEWKEQFSISGLSVDKVLTPTELYLEGNDDPTTEFTPLESIPEHAFSLLSEHERLMIKYANKLSFRVFFSQQNQKNIK